MRKSIKRFFLPLHWMIPLIFTLILNTIVYNGVRIFTEGRYHYNLSGPLDELVPFTPQFIVVYFGCFIFWIVNYVIIARGEKEACYRFFTADFYARLVCLLEFFFFPTTNTRPILEGSGIWTEAVRFLYAVDPPTNLLPSIHCMASWFCYIGIRSRKDIPGWYKLFSVITAAAVFYSTLALRQHVLLDVAAGILLAESAYFVSLHTKGYRTYMRISEKLGDRLMEKLMGGTVEKTEGLEDGKQEENGV